MSIVVDRRPPRSWSAEAYARSFALMCAGAVGPLLEAGGLAGPGDVGKRLLDVGTGTGSLAQAAALLGAEVTAVDPDPEMLALAERASAWPHYVSGALPALPFPDSSFDSVLANFVINHVADPRAATREMVRVAAPGGRVAATIWPSEHSALNDLWTSVIEQSGAPTPPGTRLPAAIDFPRTGEGLAALLRQARLEDVRAVEITWQHRADPETFWEGAAAGNGGIGAVVSSQPIEMRDRMKATYDEVVQPLLDGDDLVLPCHAVLAFGVKAT